MTCMPTTRQGYLAAVGRFLWEVRIEPRTFELAAKTGGGNPFAPAANAVRPTAAEALAAVVARSAAAAAAA